MQTERAVPWPGQGWAGPGVAAAVQQELASQPPQHHGHQPRQEGHTLFIAARRSFVGSPLVTYLIYLVLKVPVTDVGHWSAQACDQWPVRAVRRRDVHRAVKMKMKYHSAL